MCPRTSGREHDAECQRRHDTTARWLLILAEEDQDERQLQIGIWKDELIAAEEAEEEAELEGLSEEGADVIKQLRPLAEPFVRLVNREQKKVNNLWSNKVAKERKSLKKWK